MNDGRDRSMQELGADVQGLKDAVFGYWRAGERVPGLIEQTNTMLREMKERDNQYAAMLDHVGQVAWAITRPVLVSIGILIVVGVANVVTRIDPHTLLKLAGHQ